MKLGLAALTAVAVALIPPSAQAALLTANKQCYREGDRRDPVTFGGGPFTPGGRVNVTLDGVLLPQPLLAPGGIIAGTLSMAPNIDPARERPFTIVATDQANPAMTGTLIRLASQLRVDVRPTGGRPERLRRISARGFTGGGTLYAHVVRGRSKRTVRIGRLKGACGTLTARRRVFRRGTRAGRYRVQFDTSRRYARTTYPNRAFSVRIFTIFRPRASTLQRWLALG